MFFVKSLQAAKTPRRVFVILLALCVCCTLFGAVCANNITWPRKVEIFAQDEIYFSFEVDGVEHNITSDLSYVPLFVFADGVIAAFAKGKYTRDGNGNIDIVARYIETEGKNWTNKITENNGSNWKTQLAMHENIANENSYFFLNNFMAATNENKIYLFALNINRPENSVNRIFIQSIELYLSVGEIKTNVTSQGAEKIIEWQSLDEQADKLTRTLRRELPNASLYAGTVSFIKDKKNIFVFDASIDGEDVSVFVSSDNMESMIEWDVLLVYPPEGCNDPRFVMWENKLLMFPNGCVDGKQTVMKSLDMGKTWTTAEPSFVRLFEWLNYKDDFTVATINNKTAFIFNQVVFEETVSGKKCEIHFWISDGNRMRNIGPVAADNEYISSVGIVYTNGELFFMYQQRNYYKPKKAIVSHLDKELMVITSVLNTWDKVDKYLSTLCNKNAEQNAPLDTLCVTPVLIDGLVGFLSDGVDNNTYWRDEYLYVGAIVKGGTKVTNGFTFIGAGAGAKWRLEQNGKIPYYIFVQYGLTAVATVRIHSALENNTPLLTVGGAGQNTERQGLWYGSDGQWKVMSGRNNVAVSAAGGWETNRTYHVALVVQYNTITAYVDGSYVGSDMLRTPVLKKRPFAFLHLFIAGYEDNDGESTLSNVTVTNVLLYNRQLNETEMRAMSGSLES